MDTNRFNLIPNDNRIFHQEEYDIDVLRIVKGIKEKGDHFVTFEVETHNGQCVYVTIMNYNNQTYRIMMSKDLCSDHQTMIEYDENELYSKKLEVIEEECCYSIRNQNLVMKVNKNLFNLSLFNENGDLLWDLENTDKKSWCVTPPMAYRHSQNSLEEQAVLSFRMKNDEHFYGLGEKFSPLDKRHTKATIWAADTMGTNTTDLSYKSIPVLFSTYNYGIIFNTTYKSQFEIGTFSYPTASVLVEESCLDFYIWSQETFKETVQHYYSMVGKPHIIPKWALGVWMSKCSYNTNEELENLISMLKNKEIPIDCINIDTGWLKEVFYHTIGTDACDFAWNDDKLKNRKELFQYLKSLGYHLCMWINPYIAEHTDMYKEASSLGYLVKDDTGRNARIESGEAAGLVDFTNPQAKEWWQNNLEAFVDDGMDCFKPDYADRTPKNAIFYNGKSGKEMHNIYSHYYIKAVDELIYRKTGEHIMFRRAGYIGTQKYPVTWAGDTQTSWSALKCVMRAGLSAGLCGEAFWSHDVGGFTGPKPSDELYVRWVQFAMFSPITRFHGTTPREPWNYGEKAEKIAVDYIKLRYKMLPYIYHHARKVHEDGLPIIKPLVLEYSNDPSVYNIEDEYLFGDHILVAPIINHGKNERYIYFPKGKWASYNGNEKIIQGGSYQNITAPLERLPLFLKDGSIIPLHNKDVKNSQEYVDDYKLVIFVNEENANLTFKQDNQFINAEASINDDILTLNINHNIKNLEIEILYPKYRQIIYNDEKVVVENKERIIISK